MKRKDQSRLGGWIIVAVAAVGTLLSGPFFFIFLAMAGFGFYSIGYKTPNPTYIATALYVIGGLLAFNAYITIFVGCVVAVGVYLAVQGTKPVPGLFR